MKLFAAALLLSSCAHRVCGELDPRDVSAFHESHQLSVGANASAVEGLASEPWQVCIEGGVAKIQNHQTASE